MQLCRSLNIERAVFFMSNWRRWSAFKSRLDEAPDYLICILPLQQSHLIAIKLS